MYVTLCHSAASQFLLAFIPVISRVVSYLFASLPFVFLHPFSQSKHCPFGLDVTACFCFVLFVFLCRYEEALLVLSSSVLDKARFSFNSHELNDLDTEATGEVGCFVH